MAYERPTIQSGVTRITKPFVENILDGIDEKLSEADANATYAPSSEAVFDATKAANGNPTVADTGQQLTFFGNAPLSVSGGKIVHTVNPAGFSGGYVQVPLSGPVVESVVEFEFPSASAAVVTLAWPASDWNGGTHVDFSQVVGLHLTVTRTTWTASTYDGPNQTTGTTVYGTGSFATALATGVRHRVAVNLDRATNTVTFTLPDGSTHQFTNAFLTTNTGPFAVFELYEQLSSTAPAVITKFSASSDPNKAERVRTSDLVNAVVGATARRDNLVKKWAPTAAQFLAPNSGLGIIDPALALNGFVVPDSGYFLVTLQGQIAMSAASQVFWGIYTDTGTNLAQLIVVTRDTSNADQKFNGLMQAEFLCQRTPGSVVNLVARHYASVASTTYFKVSPDNAAIIRAHPVRVSP